MARPTLGDTPSVRLHLTITAAEVEAINDWRFSNRVASLSEAIRQLCAKALAANRPAASIGAHSEADDRAADYLRHGLPEEDLP